MKEEIINLLKEYEFETSYFDFFEGPFISSYLEDKKFIYYYNLFYDEYGLFFYDEGYIYELNTTKDKNNKECFSMAEHTISGRVHRIKKNDKMYNVLSVLKKDLLSFFLSNKKHRIKFLLENFSN